MCSAKDCCLIEMPTEENKILKFKNFKNTHPIPTFIVYDIECLHSKENLPLDTRNTQYSSKMKPCSIGYIWFFSQKTTRTPKSPRRK